MNKIKCVFLVISATLICSLASAQVKDSLPIKSNVFSKINLSKLQLPKMHLPKFTLFKKDSAAKANKLPKEFKVENSLVVKDIKPVDTAKKNWLPKLNFSKIRLPKFNLFKKDSSIVKSNDTLVDKRVTPIVNQKVIVPEVEKVVKISVPAAYLNQITKDTSKATVANIIRIEEDKPIFEKKADTQNKKAQVETVKDTTKKASWLTRLTRTKKATVKTDSTMNVATMAVKAKDTVAAIKVAVKAKDTVAAIKVAANAKDTVAKKVKIKEVKIAKLKDTTSIYKSMEQKFLKYTATTTVSLFGGANFSKQTIDAAGYKSNFNYNYADINDDVYKTGYFGGIRLDGKIKKKHEYSLGINLAKISSGANFISSTSLRPVVGNFSTFKAEDHFFVINIAAHYKKLIPYGDLEKFKFYIVGGPSIDARLSNTSIDNQVSNAYKQIFMKGDIGLEFNNRSLYTLFLHYQHNLGSLTKLPIKTNINTFQFGILIKAVDLL